MKNLFKRKVETYSIETYKNFGAWLKAYVETYEDECDFWNELLQQSYPESPNNTFYKTELEKHRTVLSVLRELKRLYDIDT